MYLIAIFEKRVNDLIEVPETEKEVLDMFDEDIQNFLNIHKDEYHVGELMKIPFATEVMIGVEIFKI